MKFRDFLIRQPGYPEQNEYAELYYGIAEKLLKTLQNFNEGHISDSLLEKIALTLTDYLQDIVADGGVWRSFVEMNRSLYGWSVPFHPIPEEYIDYELNREDVRFLVWYVISMLDIDRRDLYPHKSYVLKMADECYNILEQEYDEAPTPSNWNLALGLEMHDPEDQEKIMRLTLWLFNNSYLLTPAFALDLHSLLDDPELKGEEALPKIRERLDNALMEMPTGPLALFAFEWTSMIVSKKLPNSRRHPASTEEHPYYTAFVKATGGKVMEIFSDYDSMNNFFIDKLGWEAGKEHLAMSKGAHDYVLLVNKHKGMLMARDIARCINAPDNPLYDADFAKKHTFDLLTVRGLCPADLYHYISEQGWWAPTSFPKSDDPKLVSDNRDFIARCYLQQYYVGD